MKTSFQSFLRSPPTSELCSHFHNLTESYPGPTAFLVDWLRNESLHHQDAESFCPCGLSFVSLRGLRCWDRRPSILVNFSPHQQVSFHHPQSSSKNFSFRRVKDSKPSQLSLLLPYFLCLLRMKCRTNYMPEQEAKVGTTQRGEIQ